MSGHKEKQAKKVKAVVKDLNLRLVKPVTIHEVNELKALLKKGSNDLWKYLQKRD